MDELNKRNISSSISSTNGINAQIFGTVIETINNRPEMTKVTFQVQTQNGRAVMALELHRMARIIK